MSNESPYLSGVQFLYITLGFLLGGILFRFGQYFTIPKELRTKFFSSEYIKDIISHDGIAAAIVFCFWIICISSLQYSVDINMLMLGVIFRLVYKICYQKSLPEIQEIREKHQLNIGHGAAMFYYHNYLAHIMDTFEERIKQFISKQQVDVKEKLIILIPRSCKIPKTCHKEEKIERARELIPFHLDIAGIKNRIYNVTVYQIFKTSKDSVWCAVEFAQPLHDLYDMQFTGQITKNEMYQEWRIFVQTLTKLLSGNNIIYLYSYDDESPKFRPTVHDVILDIVEHNIDF